MHGRPRKATTPEEEKASAVKASHIRSLQSQFLHFHHNKIYTKEALEINAKLVGANPEYYTAWNYRRLAIEHRLTESDSLTDDPDFVKSIFDEELRVVEKALEKNYKSYGAWHHRKWVLSKGHSSTDRELWLLGRFQKADPRNFHAWNYRRFITALKNITDEEELQYTTNMICDDFSNYSAWHNRSVLLSHLLKKRVQGYFPKESVLTEEYDFVRNALFTDPDDQSGWFYHHWLLDQAVKLESPVLVSSWPPHGSDLCVSRDGTVNASTSSPFSSFRSNTGIFPLVLYFNEVVEGVSSSTVTVESEYDMNNNLIWRPLSMNNDGRAEAWVTHLSFPDKKFHSSKAFQVKVSLGYSQGIISLSGIHYSNPSHIAFKVSALPCNSEHAERQTVQRISWEEENFIMHETHFLESSPLCSFHQLRINGDNAPIAPEWNAKTIANEIAHCRELLSAMNCKIGKLTLARLLMAHDAMMSYNSPNVPNVVYYEEVLELYRDLMKLDPPHSQYYEDEYSLVLLKQATSNSKSMLGYCRQYRYSISSSIKNSLCLQLNNLSLSRIGSVEQLLWVQMLDLSHNQLRSIEGLEAMQLLSCLNLSNNELHNFTALEPLRLMKSLKVLDVSYNKIGVHSVDTRRYLCSSPLSHTVGSDWNFEEFATSGVNVTNYWEAFSVFRGLNLIQLDIAGNTVANEKFKLFLFKLLPALKWLDGAELKESSVS